MILGTGIDVVHLPAFRDQLADRASAFVRATFTVGEQAAAEARPDKDPARHLAVRFAAKEAFIKAWAGARWGRPPLLAQVDLREIEIVCDAWERPRLILHGAVATAILAAQRAVTAHVSLTHDGDHASAVVVLEGSEALR